MTDLVAVACITNGTIVALAAVNMYINRKNRQEEKAENKGINASVDAYHKEVNNKMDQFIKVVKRESHREGKLEGAAEANLKEKP